MPLAFVCPRVPSLACFLAHYVYQNVLCIFQKRRIAEEAISRGDVVLIRRDGSPDDAVPVTRIGDLSHYSTVGSSRVVPATEQDLLCSTGA